MFKTGRWENDDEAISHYHLRMRITNLNVRNVT